MMADIVWELMVLNAVLIVVSTGLPYTMLADHHFSRFILVSQNHKITIKQPHYCHEN